MTSRAIVRRKKCLFNYLNQPTCLTRRFCSFEYQQSIASKDCLQQSSLIRFSSHSSEDTDCQQEGGSSSVTKDELFKPLKVDFLRHNFFQISNLGYQVGRVNTISSLQAGLISQSVRHLSPATAGQCESDGNEQQVKEASPEVCDQVAEGLSSVKVKAKAKAKQMQDTQKSAKSTMQRVWAMLLGRLT